jgi:MinD superfamily P-loop ATPase
MKVDKTLLLNTIVEKWVELKNIQDFVEQKKLPYNKRVEFVKNIFKIETRKKPFAQTTRTTRTRNSKTTGHTT